jgi:hypothetical protein
MLAICQKSPLAGLFLPRNAPKHLDFNRFRRLSSSGTKSPLKTIIEPKRTTTVFVPAGCSLACPQGQLGTAFASPRSVLRQTSRRVNLGKDSTSREAWRPSQHLESTSISQLAISPSTRSRVAFAVEENKSATLHCTDGLQTSMGAQGQSNVGADLGTLVDLVHVCACHLKRY